MADNVGKLKNNTLPKRRRASWAHILVSSTYDPSEVSKPIHHSESVEVLPSRRSSDLSLGDGGKIHEQTAVMTNVTRCADASQPLSRLSDSSAATENSTEQSLKRAASYPMLPDKQSTRVSKIRSNTDVILESPSMSESTGHKMRRLRVLKHEVNMLVPNTM